MSRAEKGLAEQRSGTQVDKGSVQTLETGTGGIPTEMLFVTAGREFVLTKLDHSFTTAPQKGLYKNVNSNRRTRNYIGLLLYEVGHLTNRDTK